MFVRLDQPAVEPDRGRQVVDWDNGNLLQKTDLNGNVKDIPVQPRRAPPRFALHAQAFQRPLAVVADDLRYTLRSSPTDMCMDAGITMPERLPARRRMHRYGY